MTKHAKFLYCIGTPNAEEVFIQEYQRAVLLTLQREGLLDQYQFELCIQKLRDRVM